MKEIDISGFRYGRLTAIKLDHQVKTKKFWLFQCDCGKQTIKRKEDVTGGKTTSCGCYRQQVTGTRTRTHGMTHQHRLYSIWLSMKRRCGVGNCDSQYHGDRGIRVCERWLDFENFIEDMDCTYREGLSIDRIDNNGNYEPNNCRWADRVTQNRNQRRNRSVVSIDRNGNIKHYEYLQDVEQDGCHYSNVQSCCAGRIKSAYGRKWFYKEDYKDV